MPDEGILRALAEAWSRDGGRGKRLLDLSCGAGTTARMLAAYGAFVVATDYGPAGCSGDSIRYVGGVDLNDPLPFKSACFDGINLTEVIEHIEHQAQLIREMSRVVREEGVVVISTPNVLNVLSRLRFLFTGFLRGRVRPAHYSRGPGVAPNIYLLHFYELYYLLFHYGFEIEELRSTKVKFAPVFFTLFLYPFMWLFSLEAVIHAEKDPVQRKYNWQILKYFFSRPLLFSDNIVVKARKKRLHENRFSP
jgi:SAM-dependent methyltransferase